MRVIGLDLSLTSTGIAVIDSGEVTTQRIVSKGSKDATLDERRRRLTSVRRSVADVCLGGPSPALVVIEGPSFGQVRQGGQYDRAGLWWLVLEYLTIWHHVVEVPPATRAKYATGRGNAAKDDVLSAAVRRYPNVDVNGNDEADALILAAMGARWLGHPIEGSLPATHLAAMTGVAWPDVTP